MQSRVGTLLLHPGCKSRLAFNAGHGDALHELTLRRKEENEDRQQHDQCHRHHIIPR